VVSGPVFYAAVYFVIWIHIQAAVSCLEYQTGS